MTSDDPQLEIYEPSFEEISDSTSPFYDERWFESDLLPQDHEWFHIISEFLYMCMTVRQYEYNGENLKLAEQQKHYLNLFNSLIPEIEDLIRGEYKNLEFAEKWSELKNAYQASGAIKKEQKARTSRGTFTRYTEEHRAWYARVFILEKEKGKHSKGIKYDIAKFAELIKAGKISVPPLWNELKFEKILHKNSTLKNPMLNNDLNRDMTIKTRIPNYSTRVAPMYKLPPFEIKTSG